jgi:hypothetical protein
MANVSLEAQSGMEALGKLGQLAKLANHVSPLRPLQPARSLSCGIGCCSCFEPTELPDLAPLFGRPPGRDCPKLRHYSLVGRQLRLTVQHAAAHDSPLRVERLGEGRVHANARGGRARARCLASCRCDRVAESARAATAAGGCRHWAREKTETRI